MVYLVQTFKVDLVHRGVPKVAGVRGKAVAGGGDGSQCPWREEKAVARGEEGSQCPWREKKSVAGGGEGLQRPWWEGKTVAGGGCVCVRSGCRERVLVVAGSYLMVTQVAPMGPMV